MKINYNVTGSDRKQLVSIITHETGIKATYKGVPSLAYCIGGITVEKDGTMVWDENTDTATIQKITEALAAAGFEGAGDKPQPAKEPTVQEEKEAAEPVELTVSPPIGTLGTVVGVDSVGTIHVNWDNGCGLGVAYGEDACRRIDHD